MQCQLDWHWDPLGELVGHTSGCVHVVMEARPSVLYVAPHPVPLWHCFPALLLGHHELRSFAELQPSTLYLTRT